MKRCARKRVAVGAIRPPEHAKTQATNVQVQRFRRALAVMLCCGAAFFLSNAIAWMTDEGNSRLSRPSFDLARQTANALSDPAGANAAAQQFVSGLLSSSSHGLRVSGIEEPIAVELLPDALTEEAPLPPAVTNCLVDVENNIIGYRSSGTAEEALGNLRESMASAGWRATAVGGIAGLSFEKDNGALRWAFATVTHNDDGTFVVLRLVG